jgi:membrane protease YdiL (CAAX protease family)
MTMYFWQDILSMALPATPRPVFKQGWIRAILYFIAYLLISLLASTVAAFLWVARQPGVTTVEVMNDPDFLRTALLIASVLAIAAALLFRRLIDRQSILSMGFQWKGYERQAGIGLALAPALLGIGSLLLFFTGHIWWTDTDFNASAFFGGLGLFALTAVEEEVVFRGYILNNLLGSFNKWVALAITTVIFTLVHMGNMHINALATFNLFLGGALLGINYIYTRNLWFSILFHFGWNFCQGSVLGYEVSGLGVQSLWPMDRNGADWLSGGQFGFEGSVMATVVLLLGCGVVWLMVRADTNHGVGIALTK